jgi:kinesin family protein 14
MMGLDIDVGNSIGKEVGIIPRFCHELFERIASLEDSDIGTGKSTCNVEISYFEIYNEKIHDLLGGSSDGKRAALKVREHPVFGPYIVDLSVLGVTSYEDITVCFKRTSCLRNMYLIFEVCCSFCSI